MAYRCKHGVDDMVMLKSISEKDILENLRTRFSNELIYTYIGHVLIAMNPYRMVKGLYSEQSIRNYRGKYPYEESPHLFAIADDMYCFSTLMFLFYYSAATFL
jgi:myosin-1